MEHLLQSLQTILTDFGRAGYLKLMENLPDLFWAAVIVAVGILLSAVLYYLVIQLLRFFAVDKLAAKTPLQRLLSGLGISRNASEILALLVFWLCILATLLLAGKRLEIPEAVAWPLQMVTLFIPRLIAALVIAILGLLLAKVLQTVTLRALGHARIGFAGGMSRAVYIIVAVYVIYLALSQLLDLSTITAATFKAAGALLLVILIAALAVSRHILEDAMACLQTRRLLKPGQHVVIGSTDGTVAGFTLTGVIISSQGRHVVVPADDFFRTTYSTDPPHGRNQ